MRIFKNKEFALWAKEQKLADFTLKRAIHDIEEGLFEANLGGNVYKKRISLGNRGKSGGARTIIAFKRHNNTFFIYGFAKNERTNITPREQHALKALAKIYFTYDEKQINRAIEVGALIEVLL
jgi:hypothetical protein